MSEEDPAGMGGYSESVRFGGDSPWLFEAEARTMSDYPRVEVWIGRGRKSSSFYKTIWDFTNKNEEEKPETIIERVLREAKKLEIPIRDGDRAGAMAVMLRVRHQAVRAWVRHKAQRLLPFFGPEDVMEAWALAVGDAVIDS